MNEAISVYRIGNILARSNFKTWLAAVLSIRAIIFRIDIH